MKILPAPSYHGLKLAVSITLVITALAGMCLVPIGRAAALTGSNFNPGHIIDDGIFTNSLAMSPTDIQNFLNAQVPTCDTNGTQLSTHPNGSGGFYTHAQWGAVYDSANNTTLAAAPYVCLKSYVENPTTGQSNLQNPSASINGGQSAAQIIYNAGQAFGINPEVILTTLQKEQGLVTDNWPWTNEYTEAMGYNCPDTPQGCTGFAGFADQVTSAAKQFRNYLTNPNNFNYVVGSNTVAYSPSCGGPAITIQNQATAALYDYTPYQPDAKVLAATNPTGSNSGPGGSVANDSCAAYGNRNFWWYFNSWFGASLASAYTWQYVGQADYTDASLSTPINQNSLVAGHRYYLTLSAENVGTATWTQGKINLGTANPYNGSSPFYDSSWLSSTRPATLQQSSVAPGATGTFGFWITAPAAGNYAQYFDLVAENITWMNNPGLNYQFSVQPERYTWAYQGQQVYTDQTKTTVATTNNTNPGQRYYVTLSAQNTGNVTWTQGKINLGTASPYDGSSPFYDSSWLSTNRAATLDQASVAPGATGTFSFWVKAPLNQGGLFNEYFDPIAEGITWMNNLGQYYQFNVMAPNYSWSLLSQGLYTDASKSTTAPAQLARSTQYYASITIKNTGDVIWYKNSLNLGTSNPYNRTSIFHTSTWLSPNRPATMQEAVVNPGQTATYNFWVQTPNSSGNYKEYFDFVAENITWLNDIGLYYPLNVN